MKKFFVILSLLFCTQVHSQVLELLSTTPSAAYSLRKLRSSYTGSAIQVRRSSDNQLLEIGFDSNGYLDTTSLKIFVGTGDGFVRIWYDQSGLNNNATQTTNTSQPTIIQSGALGIIRNQVGLRFDGTRLLTIPSMSFSETSIVGSRANNTNTFFEKDGGSASRSFDLYGAGAAGFQAYLNYRVNGSDVTGPTDSKNRLNVYNGTNSQDIRVLTARMGFGTPSVVPLTGFISEFINFSTALDATNRGLLENNQIPYWLPSSLGSVYQSPSDLAGTVRVNLVGVNAGTYTVEYSIGGVAQTAVTGVVTNAYGQGSFVAPNITPSTAGQTLLITRLTRTDIGTPLVLTPTSNNSIVLKVVGMDNIGTSSLVPAVAYGLRKMTSVYEGPAIEVRRSSDNTYRQIGFDATGNLDTVALKQFVGSGNGFVRTWYNQGSGGVDMQTTVVAREPRIVNGGVIDRANGGRPALFHDDVDDALSTGTGVLTARPFMTSIVASKSSPISIAISPTLLMGVGTNYFQYIERTGSQPFRWQNSGSVSGEIASSAITNSLSTITAQVDNTGLMNYYVNGGSYLTSNSTTATTGPNGLATGGNGNGNPWGGHIEEIIGAGSTLADSDRRLLEQNQRNYYGMAALSVGTLDRVGLTNVEPEVAYSLRRLSSAYTGAAIQVRRSSDNQLINIGFTASGILDTAALKTFVGTSATDTGYVSIWYNQGNRGPNGRNMSNTNTSAQPRIITNGIIERQNGVPALFHDGTNDGLSGGSGYLMVAPYTLNTVWSINTGSVTNRRAINGVTNQLGLGIILGSGSLYIGNSTAGSFTPTPRFTPFISTGVVPGLNNTKFYSEGIDYTPNSVSLNSAPNGLATGAAGLQTNEPLNGWVSEVIATSTQMSNVDRNTLEQNQRTFFKTIASLDSVNQVSPTCNNTNTLIRLFGLQPNSTSGISYSLDGIQAGTISGIIANNLGIGIASINFASSENGKTFSITKIVRTDFGLKDSINLSTNNSFRINLLSELTFGSVTQTPVCTSLSGPVSSEVVLSGLLPNNVYSVTYRIASSSLLTVQNVNSNNAGTAIMNIPLSRSNDGQNLTITSITLTTGGASCSINPTVNASTIIKYSSSVLDGNMINSDQVICSSSTPVLINGQTPTGDGNIFNYKWESSNTGATTGFTEISTSTNAINYQPGPVVTDTWFRRVVRGYACVSTSNAIKVTVNTISAGLIGPDQVICENTSSEVINETTGASGLGVLSYNWMESSTGNSNDFIDITGAVNATYTPGILSATKYYRRRVQSNFNGLICEAISNTIEIRVNSFTVGVVGNDQTICNGTSPSLIGEISAANGLGIFTYQWQQSSTGLGNSFTNITGANTNSYQPGILSETMYYRRIDQQNVNGVLCTKTSNTVTITVNKINAGSIGVDQNLNAGAIPSTLVDVNPSSGSGLLSYQWQESNTGLINSFTDIPNANSIEYQPSAQIEDKYYRRINASNLNGVICSAISNVVSIKINALNDVLIGNSQVICSNATPAILTQLNDAVSSRTLTYQWQVSNTGITGSFTNIDGAQSSSYQPNPASVSKYYKRITFSTLGTAEIFNESNIVSIIINTVNAGLIGSDQEICENSSGGVINEISTASGLGALTYKWMESTTGNNNDFTDIPGANNPTYAPGIQSVTKYFRRSVQSNFNGILCEALSNIIKITVKPKPVIISNPDVLFYHGDIVSIKFNGTPNGEYNWKNNNISTGLPISGSGDILYVASNTTNSNITSLIEATVKLGNCVSTIDSFNLTIAPKPILISSLNEEVCSNTLLNYNPVSNIPNTEFKWSRGQVNGISNAPNAGIGKIEEVLVNITNLPIVVFYTIELNNGKSFFETIAVKVNPTNKIINQLRSFVICSEDQFVFEPQITPSNVSNVPWVRRSIVGIENPASSGIGVINERLLNSTTSSINVVYTYNDLSSSGCFAPQDILVTVKPKPTINTVNNQVVCNNGSTTPVNFSSNIVGAQYQWSSSLSQIGIASNGVGNIASFKALNNSFIPITSSIFATASFDGCISDNKLVSSITVNGSIVIREIESSPVYTCLGDKTSQIISGIPVGGDGINYNYTWQYSIDSGVNYLAIPNSNNRVLKDAPTSINYNTFYRTLVSSGNCTAVSPIVIVENRKKPIITFENRDQYTVSIGNSTMVKVSGGSSFIWSPTENVNDFKSSSPLFSPRADTRYRVIVTNDEGCSDTASILIKVFSRNQIYPNNILTPNNDGINDLWRIKNIEFYPNNSVRIFNSNGILIRTISNYTGDWDGTVDGKKVSDGTYYYSITLLDSNVVIKGFITIIN